VSAIEDAITKLVQSAPAIDVAIAETLVAELRRVSGDAQPLARSIADVLEHVLGGRVDPGIALPPLAMACNTLAKAIEGTLGVRELEAARYEIDTLRPLPTSSTPIVGPPDVPLTQLRRRQN
jgi:hypothetical protein